MKVRRWDEVTYAPAWALVVLGYCLIELGRRLWPGKDS